MSRRDFLYLCGYPFFSRLIENATGFIAEPTLDRERNSTSFIIVRTFKQNTPVYGEVLGKPGQYLQLKIRRPKDEIEPSAAFQAEPVGQGWLRIHPDNYEYYAWTSYGVKNVYIREEHCLPVSDCEPITILPTTQNQDKLILVMYNGHHPYALFCEGPEIVAKVPVFIGGYYFAPKSPPGDHRINIIRVSRFMPPHKGVPFVMYYSASDGRAVHGSPWRYDYWNTKEDGGWGSAGCINLPCLTPNCLFNVNWNGQTIGFDNFAFRWALSNLKFNPYADDKLEVTSTDPGWYSGESSLRLVVAKNWYQLYDFSPNPSKKSKLDSWEPIKTRAAELDQYWQLPNYKSKISESLILRGSR